MLWISLAGGFPAVNFMKSLISSLALSRKQTTCTHSGKARCADKHDSIFVNIYAELLHMLHRLGHFLYGYGRCSGLWFWLE